MKELRLIEDQGKFILSITLITRNGQFPNFGYDGHFFNPNPDLLPEESTIHKDQVSDLPAILQAIKEYIRNNPSRFYLSKEVKFNKEATPGNTFSGIREICFGGDGQGAPALFPGHYSETEYEELKNLLPADRACKVPG
ncbi:1525_t:CDS:2, partial [Ambispora leptoticha]